MLADEVAQLIIEHAQQEARYLVSEGGDPPAGDDLIARSIRACYRPLKEAHDRAQNEAADRALARLM